MPGEPLLEAGLEAPLADRGPRRDAPAELLELLGRHRPDGAEQGAGELAARGERGGRLGSGGVGDGVDLRAQSAVVVRAQRDRLDELLRAGVADRARERAGVDVEDLRDGRAP